MARKRECGCYRNLPGNTSLFALGPLLIDFHLQEQKTNLTAKNFSRDPVPAPQLVSSPSVRTSSRPSTLKRRS